MTPGTNVDDGPHHHSDAAALPPDQVDLLLGAAAGPPSPWLGTWTVLATATDARNGELCGLEWSDLDLAAGMFRTERGTPVNPNHGSRAFARLAASVGLDAHPHLLRHALASAMAASKEPASIIAAQLRHADGGALAQRVYIHQLPQTAPRVAELIEGVFGPAASAERRGERNRSDTRPGSRA